ncbi:hypothetical protein Y032_0010g1024 [Ancylostoma ceylanicum]|nr:hypothetical protein Y032_0010g1024 [Ancylostoma ceylanicum]
MDATTRNLQKTILWTLLLADDVVLASEDKHELELQMEAGSDRLAQFDLRVNVKKTEYLTTDVKMAPSKLTALLSREQIHSRTWAQRLHPTAVYYTQY